jgi:hypothetical protein
VAAFDRGATSGRREEQRRHRPWTPTFAQVLRNSVILEQNSAPLNYLQPDRLALVICVYGAGAAKACEISGATAFDRAPKVGLD